MSRINVVVRPRPTDHFAADNFLFLPDQQVCSGLCKQVFIAALSLSLIRLQSIHVHVPRRKEKTYVNHQQEGGYIYPRIVTGLV